MGRNTKIDWCTASWNPVTGCLHNCEYCYARNIAHRFDGKVDKSRYTQLPGMPETFEMNSPIIKDGRKLAYPFGFSPTFRLYCLDEPSQWKGSKTIFVCSMADLFGDWVPDEWIRDVLNACRRAPQHRYLFLSKNPRRYVNYNGGEHLDVLPHDAMYWYGTSITKESDIVNRGHKLKILHNHFQCNTFISIEPILEDFGRDSRYEYVVGCAQWVIVGAESGNRKGKVIPDRAWIDKLVKACDRLKRPIFMKESLRKLMGDDFRQEFPWDTQARAAGDQQGGHFADSGALAPAT